jgi:hypothetical protein
VANIQNLKPMNKRTKSEQRKIAQKGGKASGIVRKAYKTIAEALAGEFNRTEIANEIKKIALKGRSEKTKLSALVFVTERLEGKAVEKVDSKVEITLKGGGNFAD